MLLALHVKAKNMEDITVEYINFNEISLGNLFGFLGKEYNVNFSIEPEFRQNKVSVHLQNSNLATLLQIITKENGLAYYLKNSIVYITPVKENLNKKFYMGELKREKVVLNYASIKDTLQFLQDMFPAQVVLRSTTENKPYSNLFNATPDLAIPSGVEEEGSAKVFPDVSAGASRATSAGSQGGVYIDKNIPSDILHVIPFYNTNTIYLQSTSSELLKEAHLMIKEIDQPLKQVLIQGEIIQLSLGDEFTSVFDLDLTGGANELFNTSKIGEFNVGGNSFDALTKNVNFSLLTSKVEANINIAKNDNRAKRLASPMLLAMNRTTSTLDLSYEAAMITSFTAGEIVTVEGASPVVKEPSPVYTTEKIGTVLKITPFINTKNEILLKVEITISDIDVDGGSLMVEDSSGDLVKREIDTVIESTIETVLTTTNGQAVIIGGLIQKKKEAQNVKVPLLGDIPIIGVPFTDIKEVDTKDEQIIILRPLIIDPKDMQADEVKKILYKNIKSKQTLQKEIEVIEKKENDAINAKDIKTIIPSIQEEIKAGQKNTVEKVKTVEEVQYDTTIDEFLK